jgi:Predicted methyltransferase regulatory domain/Methyltransferase domain
MTSWTAGYVAELDYTHGYYREMSPQLLKLAMLSRQQEHRLGEPLRYLELGFGQGLSLNIHAAANEGEFWGTDFNPAQAANAQEMAVRSGANVKVLDASFAELAAREDLPEFDVIALHGIWSWISEENRRVIVDLVRSRLAVGGLVYMSYNTTPGWSAMIPLRQLLMLHMELASGEAQGLSARIDAALDFAQSVVDSNARYFRLYPDVAARLKVLKSRDRQYLAHEFFNADWHPMTFSRVAEDLEQAKLTFAASSNLMSHIDTVNLTAPQQKLLTSIDHPVLRESVRDYCENQQFRRDIFIKGQRRLSDAHQIASMKQKSFVLTTPEEDVPSKVTGPAGEAKLQKDIYEPLVAALGERAYVPKTVEELCAHKSLEHIPLTHICQALLVLTGLNHAQPVQESSQIALAITKTSALNDDIIERAAYSTHIKHLASPVTGGGIPVGRLQQLFIRGLMRGKTDPKDWAAEIWPVIEAQEQRLQKDGKTLMSEAENLAELEAKGQEFAAKKLPILKALLVIPQPGKPVEDSDREPYRIVA